PKGVQMFHRSVTPEFVVDDDRADRVVLQFPPNHHGGNVVFFQVAENLNVYKQPVSQHNQRFHPPVQQHFQIPLEAGSLVLDVGQDGQIRRLVERVLNAAQHERAEGVRRVEHHDPNRVAAPAAQRTRKQVGTVAQPFGGAFNTFLGGGRNVAGQRSVVQHN